MNRSLKDRLAIATMCSNWKQVAQEYGVAIEVDTFCQAENMEGNKGELAKAELTKLVEQFDVRILHGPFNELHPAAIDPKARALAMERMNQAAEIAIESGIKKMVVHSGYVPFIYFKEWHHERSVEFWKEFMEDKPGDFEICIENVLDDEPYMLADIAKAIGDDRVGLCLDVGHANVVNYVNGTGCSKESGEVIRGLDKTGEMGIVPVDGWLEVMGPYLKHLHIHNNDGTGDFHNEVMNGAIDTEKILDDVVATCHRDTTVTLEVLNCEKSLDWLAVKGYYLCG